MKQASVFFLPDFNQQFIIHMDASRSGIGATLTQNGHLISYFSKKFCLKLLNSSTYVQELHATTAAVQKWRHYLLGK